MTNSKAATEPCPERAPVALDVGAVLAASSLFRMIRDGEVGRDVLDRPFRITGLGIAGALSMVGGTEARRAAA